MKIVENISKILLLSALITNIYSMNGFADTANSDTHLEKVTAMTTRGDLEDLKPDTQLQRFIELMNQFDPDSLRPTKDASGRTLFTGTAVDNNGVKHTLFHNGLTRGNNLIPEREKWIPNGSRKFPKSGMPLRSALILSEDPDKGLSYKTLQASSKGNYRVTEGAIPTTVGLTKANKKIKPKTRSR